MCYHRISLYCTFSMECHVKYSVLLITILGIIRLHIGYASIDVENITAIGNPEDGSSAVNDVPKQPMGPDVFRQLLNQETLIRMTLVKNVNSLMLDMVSLKDSVVTLQKNVEQIAKISVEDTMGFKLEIKKLKNANELLKEINQRQNQTISKLVDDLIELKNDQVQYAKEMRDGDVHLMGNTSAALTELKTNFRILSLSLVSVDKQSQDFKKRLNEVNESLPQTINETFGRVEESVKKISRQISESTNDSLQNLRSELEESNQSYLRLSAAVLSLQWFKNNISGKCDIQKRIGFTAGKRLTKSDWSDGKLIFNKVLFNQGNGYDPTSGIFSAPSSGVYVFFVSITSYSNEDIKVDITHNGTPLVTAWGNGHSERIRSYGTYSYVRYQTGTNMAVASLKTGDKVWIQYRSGTGFFSDSVPITTFSGFVI